MNIDWNDPNLDLDKILWIPDLDKKLWISDLDKTETEFNFSNENFWQTVSNILENFDTDKNFNDLIREIEKEKNIEINFWEKNGGFVEIYKNKDLVWRIWKTWYKITDDIIDENHLWIEVYWEYEWKWYSKLLYKIYYKYSLENDNIFFPEYEFAKKNSRINLLLKLWYKVIWYYTNWFFYPDEDIDININDYYWEQDIIYKFKLDN